VEVRAGAVKPKRKDLTKPAERRASSSESNVNVEIIKDIAWPLVIFVLAGSVIWILRKKLPAMSDRILGFKVNKDGLEASLAAAASLQLDAKAPEAGLSRGLNASPTKTSSDELSPELAQRLNAVRSLHVMPIVQEQEKLIRADIEQLKIAPQELSDLLIRHLAVTQLALRAETVYRTIFGSQIALLKAANLFGSRDETQLLQFYDQAKDRFPLPYTSYSFDQYLQYLLSQGLLVQNHEGKYVITVAGKEFLKWLADVGATEDKLF
jgi:hypothetical protein